MVFQEFEPPALHIVYPLQLWSSPWGYGGSAAETNDGISLQLGKLHLLGGLAAIIASPLCYIFRNKKHVKIKKQKNSLMVFNIIGLLFSLFMLLPLSIAIWNFVKPLYYIQFPWRFLVFASLTSSVLSAAFISSMLDSVIRKNSFKVLLFSLIYCVLIIRSYKFFQPQFKYPISSSELTSRARILWEISNRSHEYLPIGFEIPLSQNEALETKNPRNVSLINQFKRNTIRLQKAASIISLATTLSLIGYYFYSYAKSRKYRRNRN